MDEKANRQRNIQKKFFVSELENKIIEKNMREANLQNFSTYVRKSCLDKKIYTVDFSSLMYLIFLSSLSYSKYIVFLLC